MHITLIMVETVDGKTTQWHEPEIHGWSSEEDQKHFRSLLRAHTLLVMGRKTYEGVKNQIHLSPNLRRIVLTKRPEKYKQQSVKGELEFSDESPSTLVKRMEENGYTSMLLVGGSEVNEAFLSAGLITDCMITIEPRFFGEGRTLFASARVDIPLTLIDVKKLNPRGTLLLHYTVDYDHSTR